MAEKLSNEIIKKIQKYDKNATIQEIADELKLSTSTVHKYRWKMQEEIKDTFTKDEKKKLDIIQKYSPKQLEELLSTVNANKKKEINEIIWEKNYLKLGICSDKHYNDKECDEQAISDFYKECDSEQVDAVVDSWDLTCGIWVYKWQIFDVMNISFKDQIDHIVNNHPRLKNWKKTYIIWWNHDMSWNDVAWINFVEEVAKQRDDIIHVWNYQWNITLNDIKIWLQHWSKWIPYSISYHLQKYIEKIPQWQEPDIYSLWHYHSSLMLDYHWIMCFLPWAFQRWNLLTKRMWLTEDNIWWRIVEIIKQWDKIRINPKYYRF